jgi:CBS domain-containing protein
VEPHRIAAVSHNSRPRGSLTPVYGFAMSASRTAQPSYIGPAFEDARVYDAMRVGVVTCTPGTSLQDAARMMAGYGIHCLVVAAAEAGRHAESWGVVDALDVARAEAEGKAKSVGEVAAAEVVTIDSDAPLSEAARVMAEQRSSHLVAVQAGTDRPVGVLSASGLAAVLAWGRS